MEMSLKSTDTTPSTVVKVKLDSDGIFNVIGSEATYDVLVEQEVKVPKTTPVPETTTVSPSENVTTTTPEFDIQKIQVPKKIKLHLKLETVQQGYPLPMSDEERRAMRSKLRDIVDAENKIKLRTKTKNDLEALIYSLRDKMEDDKRIANHSTVEERNTVVQATRTVEEWLDDYGYKADVDAFKEKIGELKNALKPIQDRIDEETRKLKEEEELKAKKLAEELATKLAAEKAAKSESVKENTQESKSGESTSDNNHEQPNEQDQTNQEEREDIAQSSDSEEVAESSDSEEVKEEL
jgi:hypothetical protein